MDLGLRGRVAFVAASSRGLGRAIAEEFAAEGADVALCARDRASLAEAAAAVRGRGVRAHEVACDVADASAVAAAVESAVGELGRLDALVVNAGGPPVGAFETVDDQGWQAAFELTLMSGVRLVRAALPALRRSDAASILFSSSYAIRQRIEGLLLSNSLRLGVLGLAKTLAAELAPQVRVNTLLPGLISTERTVHLAQSRARPGQSVEEVIAEQARDIPLGRYGEPAEYARVAVFLCSPAASYVHGATVTCDGGVVRTP